MSDPRLLETIDDPAALRRLAQSQLVQVAAELRTFLIDSVALSGGHFAAGLGVVELTIALHTVFDTPRDTLVWDVGHQCYPHKALTGRRAALATIRRRGGLSGFLRREESVFDALGAGHAGTSISAALGMALANAQQGCDAKTVAVIGDGGLTAGLAFEALEHAGATHADLLVVLNDNGMSISPNVGAMPRYLASQSRNAGHDDRSGGFFRDLGLRYLGPCDGHDLPALLATLEEAKALTGPRLLHVVTQKGRGYAPAEAAPVRYHGVTPFNAQTGIVAGASTPAPTYTDVFGEWLCEMAAHDPRLVAITPAMPEGSGLARFAARFPTRFYDVGIAEQHSVTLAAGLACRGMKPVVAIYSTFLQRAYDQLVHDIALQRLPVLFAIDRAGLVGPDGATHNGSLDLSYLRCVPGMTVMTPADGAELRDMLFTGYQQEVPVAVRYPRAAAVGMGAATAPPETLRIGLAEPRRAGKRVALLAFGTLLQTALEIADSEDYSVINMRFVKPIDTRAVLELARTHELLVTLEENAIAGGAGGAVNECLVAHGQSVRALNIGIPDRPIEHGTRDEVLHEAQLDRAGILAAIAGALAMIEPARHARARSQRALGVPALTPSRATSRHR